MPDILHYTLTDFVTSYGVRIPSLRLYYQCFGLPLGEAPVVVVNHAFTVAVRSDVADRLQES